MDKDLIEITHYASELHRLLSNRYLDIETRPAAVAVLLAALLDFLDSKSATGAGAPPPFGRPGSRLE
jgi:hypothetical protein